MWTPESFSCVHTCTPLSQEKPPFVNETWNFYVIISRLLELHSSGLFYELSTQVRATPAQLLDTTTTRNNKLLEGHSKLITSWELGINTVLWNNLKYFDLQGILQGSFKKEINSMFRIEGTKWKWCQRGRTGFSDAFVNVFFTGGVWKQPHSKTRSKQLCQRQPFPTGEKWKASTYLHKLNT